MKNRTLPTTLITLLSTITTTSSYIPPKQNKNRLLPPLLISNPTLSPPQPKTAPHPRSFPLTPLLQSLNATFPTSPLHLTTTIPSSSRRGLITTTPISAHAPLLLLPLSSCLSSDSPPSWLRTTHHTQNQWAIHLAALFLDAQDERSHPEWQSLLPSRSALRGILPVHWSDEVLSKARSCALELSVDRDYFSRAESVEMLLTSYNTDKKRWRRRGGGEEEEDVESSSSSSTLAERVHYALDIVQTRACRVERLNSLLNPPLRIIAPLFDFLNHGGVRGANAAFQLEEYYDDGEAYLVVRATRDLEE
eukprot:CAMPEP_0172503668 /NCGR_PEP_ID=MMETSP1066-20121228/171207_1 /TAXON_ID=671091 /ORGANISM="Coscinodiscus wailesii, Strain CCMP2513" /LENGTH=305 /DNA_ID=CAMNT_0013279489 /DNA_START=62 /DNA_END=976 /DNA_ORIENTATION=-